MKAPSNTTLDAKIARESVAGTTTLSQEHYAEETLRSHGFWDIPPRNTSMKPNTHLSRTIATPTPNKTSTVATVALSEVLDNPSL